MQQLSGFNFVHTNTYVNLSKNKTDYFQKFLNTKANHPCKLT